MSMINFVETKSNELNIHHFGLNLFLLLTTFYHSIKLNKRRVYNTFKTWNKIQWNISL